MSKEQHISAVVIALNEEKNITRCLNSLKDIADEILVLDSGSTDRTAALVREAGATLIEVEWKGYSATKNHGHKIAQYDYILSLDADEVPDADLQAAICLAKESGLNGAYRINRKNYLGDQWIRHSGWYPDLKVRLFHKDRARWVGDFVHEQLRVDKGQEITDLTGHLDHFTAITAEQHISTVRKYARLNAERYLREGRSYTYFKSLIQALASFIRSYLLRMGFLDGAAGWYIAVRSARGRIWRYSYFRELRKQHGKP